MYIIDLILAVWVYQMLLLLTCLINICLVSTQLKKIQYSITTEFQLSSRGSQILRRTLSTYATNAQFTKIQVRNKVSKKATQGKDRKREPCGQPFV